MNQASEDIQNGFRGYPVATVAYYGPDDRVATKVAVGIVGEDKQVVSRSRWFSQRGDVRADKVVAQQIVEFINQYQPRSVAINKAIMGCPHEEGIDYPLKESCPFCPFWTKSKQ